MIIQPKDLKKSPYQAMVEESGALDSQGVNGGIVGVVRTIGRLVFGGVLERRVEKGEGVGALLELADLRGATDYRKLTEEGVGRMIRSIGSEEELVHFCLHYYPVRLCKEGLITAGQQKRLTQLFDQVCRGNRELYQWMKRAVKEGANGWRTGQSLRPDVSAKIASECKRIVDKEYPARCQQLYFEATVIR